MAKIVVVSC